MSSTLSEDNHFLNIFKPSKIGWLFHFTIMNKTILFLISLLLINCTTEERLFISFEKKLNKVLFKSIEYNTIKEHFATVKSPSKIPTPFLKAFNTIKSKDFEGDTPNAKMIEYTFTAFSENFISFIRKEKHTSQNTKINTYTFFYHKEILYEVIAIENNDLHQRIKENLKNKIEVDDYTRFYTYFKKNKLEVLIKNTHQETEIPLPYKEYDFLFKKVYNQSTFGTAPFYHSNDKKTLLLFRKALNKPSLNSPEYEEEKRKNLNIKFPSTVPQPFKKALIPSPKVCLVRLLY